MKFLMSLIVLAFLVSPTVAQHSNSDAAKARPQNSGAALLYSEGGAFLVEGPKGWVTDRETGQRLGTCCVFYPEGATWDDAQTVMYPNIMTKSLGQETLKQLMDSNLSDFRDNNPGMSYEEGEDIPVRSRKAAKLRYFYHVNQGSFEAVAYIDEEKIVALVIVSSRTKKGLDESIPLLRSALQSYAYMDVKFANNSRPAKVQPKDKLQ